MTPRARSLLNRRMGTAAMVVAGGVLLSRILGILREIIFARYLGADAITDQYVAAFRIPDFLNYLLAGGFLSITFIPIFSRYLADDDEEGGWTAFAAVFRPIAVGITALVAIGWVAAPRVIGLIYPEFTDAQVVTTTHLTRIVLPAQIFFVLGALYTAVQYAKGQFLIPTLAPIIYNLGIIAGGIGYAWTRGAADPEGFIWGALTGAVVGNFVLQWFGARRVGMHHVRLETWRHPAIREYLLIALPLMIGQSIVVLDETFMSTFGDLVGDGAQTQLLYARRAMLVPVGVIAQAAAVAAYPFLARLFAEGRVREMAASVDRALKYVVAISLAATGLLAALSVPVIRLLFQRGVFDANDTTAAATALFFYAFAVPIWGTLQILTRAFYARRDMWTPVLIGTASTVVAIPVYLVLERSFGLRGVALASTLTLGIYTATLAVVWYSGEAGRRRLAGVLDSAGRAVPLVVVGAASAWAASWALGAVLADGFLSALLRTAVGTLVFGLSVLVMGAALYSAIERTRPTDPNPPIAAGGVDESELSLDA